MKRLARNILLMVALVCMAAMAQATTYYVAVFGSDSNPGTQAASFRTIQKGLDVAQNGDTVLVAAGTYKGVGNKNLSFRGKNLTLASLNGPAATIIDCEANNFSPAGGLQLVNGETNAAILDGFTIQNGLVNGLNGTNGAGGGIMIDRASPTIRNCVVRNNTAKHSAIAARGGGIFIQNGSPRLENCTITDNQVEAYGNEAGGGGLCIIGSGNVILTNCTLTGNRVKSTNSSAAGGGIFANGSGSLTLTNCTISGNQVEVTSGGAAGGGIYTNTSTSLTLTHCAITNNHLTAEGNTCSGGGLCLLANATVTDCTISGNRIAGAPFDAVGGGVFVASDSVNLTRCAINDNAINDSIANCRGGGVFVASTATMTITSCTIARNKIYSGVSLAEDVYGGGMHSEGSLTVTDCTVARNEAFGRRRRTNGGGLSQVAGSVTLKNCRFFGNIATTGSLVVRGGGVMLYDGASIVTNCLFVGNRAVSNTIHYAVGGGLITYRPSVITNCTFTNNSASSTDPTAVDVGSGGGLYSASHSSPTVMNCIFTGNTADNTGRNELFKNTSASLSVSYCNVEGGIPAGVTDGGHNIDAHPLFVRAPSPGSDNQWGTSDDDYGDLHLQPNSPCIDKGNASAPNLPLYDIDGFARNQGGAPDMGVDEVGTLPAFDFYVDKATGNDSTGDGTPAAPFETVSKALSMADPLGFALLHIKAGNYGSDLLTITGKVQLVNWGNHGEANIGKQ